MSAERDSKTPFDNFRHERYFLHLKFDRKRESNKSPKKLENVVKKQHKTICDTIKAEAI